MQLQRYRLQSAIIAIFATIWVAFILANPRVFLNINTYRSIITVVPFTAVLSLALTYVVICGEIDLSFPAIIGMSALVTFKVWSFSGSLLLAVVCALAVGMIIGSLNGILVAKVGIPSLITTLGMQFFWRGFIMVITNGIGGSFSGAKNTVLHNILVGTLGGIPIQFLWSIVLALIFWLVLNRHRFGSHIYFTGDNLNAARVMGINVERTKILVFAIMGITSAFIGIEASLLDLTFWPVIGEGYLLVVVACVFLGGTAVTGGSGTIFGTYVAALILGWIDTGLIAIGLTGFWTRLAYGFVIVVSLVFYRLFRR